MKSEFEKKIYLVSGAASGLGLDICLKLITNGAKVFALDFDAAGLLKLSDKLKHSEMLSTIECDITNEASVQSVIAKVGSIVNSLDGLVNSAGIVKAKNFIEFNQQDFERTFAVNVYGTFYVMKYSVPLLLKGNNPRIVNFASMAGKIPGAYTAPYAASKAAVISLTRSASVALGPKINVNSICPGIIETPMWSELGADLEKLGFPKHAENRAGQSPLQRAGKTEEVSQAALFLLSNAARYITGEDLNVSGGLVMH